MCEMQEDALDESDVRDGQEPARVPEHSRWEAVLPAVLIAGRAVEIRGEAAQVVCDVLREWIDSQNRRIEFLRPGADRERVRQIRGIAHRIGLVRRVLDAWEGVLAVPQENTYPENPDL